MLFLLLTLIDGPYYNISESKKKKVMIQMQQTIVRGHVHIFS